MFIVSPPSSESKGLALELMVSTEKGTVDDAFCARAFLEWEITFEASICTYSLGQYKLILIWVS